MLSSIIPSIKNAGEIIEKAYKESSAYRYKNDHDIVTDTDIAAEKIIVEQIRQHHPSHSIFSEEMGEELHKSEFLWVIDPLDGTTNFSHRIMRFCISVALIHKNEIIAGAVYDPMAHELFTAELGKGSFCNGKKLTGGTCADISKAVTDACKGAGKIQRERFSKTMSTLIKNVHSARAFGSTALGLCHTAAGRLDAYINNMSNLYDWAAGMIIAREAGLKTTDLEGKKLSHKQTDLLVTNNMLHPQFVELLKNV